MTDIRIVDCKTGKETWVSYTEEEKAEREALFLEREPIALRKIRDRLLRDEVDAVVSNPLRWASLTAEQQQAWADYRQALLDVPSQVGFPHSVDWPIKPQ